MGLTILGLIINTIPELRIIDNAEVLPIIATWSAINAVVLFLVCMMSLQAPMRRGEERLEIDEPIWIIGPSGTISAARIKDISLSGAGLEADSDRALAAGLGDAVRVFVTEVGFIAGTVVRQIDRFLGVEFILPASVERDLLIRKLFTAGLDTTSVRTSGWAVTRAMFQSVWQMRTDMLNRPADKAADVIVAAAVAKLPAQSLTISPQPQLVRLSELSEKRRAMAA
jgi:cellulose synthase (UDP-forming)